jgi:hypothetical protein
MLPLGRLVSKQVSQRFGTLHLKAKTPWAHKVAVISLIMKLAARLSLWPTLPAQSFLSQRNLQLKPLSNF